MLARRIFADGRRAPTRGAGARPREDVAAAVERLLAMSGQFEQRRLARPATSSPCSTRSRATSRYAARAELGRAWRELLSARRLHDELTRAAAAAQARLDELRALVADTDGPRARAGGRAARRARAAPARDRARGGRGGGRGRARARGRRGRGATRRRGRARRRAARAARARAGGGGDAAARDAELRAARDRRPSCARSSPRSRPSPTALEQVEAELDRIADAKRRYRAHDLRGAARARRRGAARSSTRSTDGHDPAAEAAEAVATARARGRAAADCELARRAKRAAGRVRRGGGRRARGARPRRRRVPRRAARRPSPGPPGADEVTFLVRPNAGLPFAPGRRDGVRRRAVADRARDRGGRGRRDDRLRRDRRRDRRPDRRTRSARRCGGSRRGRRS